MASVTACAVLLAACGQNARVGTAGGPAPPATRAAAAVRRLRDLAGLLLDGGQSAFRARLAQLHRMPVVVNQWASWCEPCRFEFPFFQHLSRSYAGRVAFLGVDSQDARPDASHFLKTLPVPYPHFFDEDTSIARTFGGGRARPTTAFFAANGKLVFTHGGSYATQAKLQQDIERHALHG